MISISGRSEYRTSESVPNTHVAAVQSGMASSMLDEYRSVGYTPKVVDLWSSVLTLLTAQKDLSDLML